MYENRAGLCYQNFEEVRTGHIFYIDKTDFIREWWEYADKVTLITRPRRFGKTLNMSMVECFFSNQYAGRSDLFEGLSIWEETSAAQRSAFREKNLPVQEYKYRELQGTFPVIFLSFGNIKAAEYKKMEYKITEVIAALYEKNSYLLEGSWLSENEKLYYKKIQPGIEEEVAAGAVHSMANFMECYYGKKVIIILDEYDTPMQEAWLYGYWDEAVRFFSSFFNTTFKTNDALERGLITGITRIAKESIFTGMNHLDVITTTSDEYATSFGFTESEVFKALDDAGLGEQKPKVKEWYDGFTFGTYTDIYNPWSIASFIKKKGKYDTYWANTSGNDLVNSLIQTGVPSIKQTMEELLQGKSFEAELDERIVFDQLNGSANAVWSLLLATGYLRVEKFEQVGRLLRKVYTLKRTNMEVESIFENMVRGWFGGSSEVYYNEFIRALFNDNVRKMNTFMNKVALNTFSSFDSGNRPSEQAEPERFYHGFVLGMMVNLADTYKVCSNRESGYGRYDVMIKPLDRTKKAYIFEFKVLDPDEDEKTLEDTLANAHRQIEEKQYEAELTSEGFAPHQIRKYGFAFRGKECLIG
ncbi:MAG: ATP-binding protein [Lachnospiraceae bacterium]|nr:ATP-binding protein [Lachnospiraceae bacterium]